MSAGTYNLVIDQGSDFALDLVIKQAGTALNLTNYSGRAQLRSSVEASSASASFTVTITNAANGALKMQLPAATSSGIAAGQYVYDLEIFTANNSIVKRIIQGEVTITPEVTR
jgi:hypothetical protein|tara:strand:- start:79 stop:417 length:339 start_codon:yes stop_codon:yes gene_type:complete